MEREIVEGADLTHIRSFLAVADAGSFTRAAEVLCLTQQAVSAHVRRLETHLGLELVERTTRRVTLTTAGAAFAEGSGPVLDELDALWAEMRLTAAGIVGAVVVGVSIGATPFGQELVEHARATRPNIEIRLREMQPLEVVAGVHDGSLDLGLALEPPDAHDLDGFPIVSGTIAAMLDRRSPLAQQPNVEVAELRELTLSLPNPEVTPFLTAAAIRFAEESGRIPTAPAVGAWAPPQAVYDGTAFAIWPTVLPTSHAPAGVAVVPITDAHQRTDVWLLQRRATLPLAAERVVELVRDRWPGQDAQAVEP